MTNRRHTPMFQDIAPMMSDRSLVHYAFNGKTWERATAKIELRRRIAAGRVDNIGYDDAVALGLAS